MTAGRAVLHDSAPENGPLLRVTGLTVRHHRHGLGAGHHLVAVDDVSLEIGRGEIVGIVGESGCGKTSLAMAITHLGRISGGTVELDGVELTTLDARRLRALRADIQVVFQDPHASLDPRQSVQAGFRELRRLQPGRTAWVTDDDLMARVKLAPELLRRYPHQLSGGQAQRVCIARALLVQPRLLVVDEPTSGLDVSVQADVLRLLLELRETTGISLLFISHDLGVVNRLCDRVYVMLDGRVVEEGPTVTLLERPTHPYTRRLLDAVPGRRGMVEERGIELDEPVVHDEPPPPRTGLVQRFFTTGRFIAGKLAWGAVTFWLALSGAFLLTRAAGDPVVSILGPFATPDQVKTLRHQLGLDRPILTQYLDYLSHASRLQFGKSLQYFTPNADLIQARLGNSLKLMGLGMTIAVIVGLSLGIVAALREGSAWDRLASALALIGQSVPIFWLGLILVLVFAVHWRWLPAGQGGGFSHLVLPAITLSLFPMAQIARLTRASLAEVLHEPYVVAARARGLTRGRIVMRHALRNASPPILTVTALQAGALLSGAVAVEYVFSWPGLGLLSIDAVGFRDFTLVQALVVVGALSFIVVNLATDLVHGLIDPRVRESA